MTQHSCVSNIITKVIAEIVDPCLFSTSYTHSIYTLDKQAECVFRTLYLFVVLGGSPKSSLALPSFLSRITITMKALKCKTLGGIRTRRLWMYVLHHAQSTSQLTPHHCSSICRVSAPRVQNCIRVRMRSPSVLPYAKYGAIFASSYLACYTPDAKVTSV